MLFSGKTTDSKLSKEQKKELKAGLKELRRQLIAAGGEKAKVTESLKELQETLERKEILRADYEEARRHLKRARESIVRLSACMSESPVEEVQISLRELLVDLSGVHHDCLIREDDADFGSTVAGIRQMTEQYGNSTGMQEIMLRSELENAKSVMDDVSGWRAPDFFSLAYYLRHEKGEALGEMENEQRNQMVIAYTREHYLDAFLRECRKAGVEPRVWEMIHQVR